MKCVWRGTLDYEKTLQEQQNFVLSTEDEEIWGLEHPKVITLGQRLHQTLPPSPDDEKKLKQNIPMVLTDRGGQATLHNEGQLVIYPLLHLKKHHLGVRAYVDRLKEVTLATLHHFQVKAFAHPTETGLFTERGKIAAFGIRVQRGRTTHGVAINICNDLSDFQNISACGMWNRPHDKMSHWNPSLTTQRVFQAWCNEWIKQDFQQQ